MSRILFWLALVFLVLAAVRSKLRKMSAPPPPPAPRPAEAEAGERMLRCAHCGVFFPASENMPANGRDYCSAAHAGLSAL